MSFEQHQEGPEVIQDVLRSAVNVINDDFDYDKFIQVFPSDPWLSKGKSIPNLSPQVKPDMQQAHHDNLRSCPPMHHNVFTFDDNSLTPKNQYPQVQKMDNNSTDKRAMMNKQNVNRNVNQAGNKSGQNNGAPILKVQITGNPNYELDESDLLNMFSRYGKVLRIEVTRHRTAYIVYDDIINALFAQKNLNGHYVRNLDIKMYVSWSNNLEEELMRVEAENRAQMANTNTIGSLGNIGSLTNLNNNNMNTSGSYSQLNISQYSNGSNNVSKSLPNLDAMNVNFPYNSAKFTCKYEIQINNDKDFKIARKIIGPKGCNMKKIIEICQYTLKRSDTNFGNDFLKLRLRGRGSGFKEGPEQKESDEALHLCVSSKFQEVYNLACKLVEDLVGGLYKEYEKFCAKQGRPLSEPVQIKRIDIYNGTEKKPEELFKEQQQQRSRQNSLDMSLSHQFSKSLSMVDHNMGGESLSAISDKENYSPKTNIMHGNGPMGQTDFTKSP